MTIYEEHEFSVRTTNILKAAGVKTLPQFLGLTEEDVKALPHAGARTWKEIATMQNELQKTAYEAQLLQAVQLVNTLLLRAPTTIKVTQDDEGFLEIYKRVL